MNRDGYGRIIFEWFDGQVIDTLLTEGFIIGLISDGTDGNPCFIEDALREDYVWIEDTNLMEGKGNGVYEVYGEFWSISYQDNTPDSCDWNFEFELRDEQIHKLTLEEWEMWKSIYG